MNFPMDKPIFQFLYLLVNTPGNGGIAVGILALLIIFLVFLGLRWVAAGSRSGEESYSYPTPALHQNRKH